MRIKEAALTLRDAMMKNNLDELVVIATADSVTFRVGKTDKMKSRKYEIDELNGCSDEIENDIKETTKSLMSEYRLPFE